MLYEIVLLGLASLAGTVLVFPPCKIDQLNACGVNQYCDDGLKQCRCVTGYIFNQDADDLDLACVKELPESGGHSIVAVVVVLLVLGALAAVLVVKRQRIAGWYRDRFSNRSNVILSEEFMIGHDDPPITA